MNFGFLNNLPNFGFVSNSASKRSPNPNPSIAAISETSKAFGVFSDFKLWGWSLLTCVPWVLNRFHFHPTFNRTRIQQDQRGSLVTVEPSGGCYVPLFRPYVAKVPWHKGPRAFLSQLFPRYGHYCGPNWSSGKDNGSLLWDMRPVDWLDFCCYCHDMGYDTHDQAKLLKADLAFLECLERPRSIAKGDVHLTRVYSTMYIAGLRNILIPYRRHLVRLQQGQPFTQWLGSKNWKNDSSREVCRANQL